MHFKNKSGQNASKLQYRALNYNITLCIILMNKKGSTLKY